MTRNCGDLKFNPIQLTRISCNGSVGTNGSNFNFLHSALSQNIVCSVRKACKSVNEIADELGVSPVYVESEAVFLYKYGFLLKKDGKIKEKRRDKMCRLKDKYASAVLAETPAHLHNAGSYGLHHNFFSDLRFILHILKHLTENEMLKLPTNAQKRCLWRLSNRQMKRLLFSANYIGVVSFFL